MRKVPLIVGWILAVSVVPSSSAVAETTQVAVTPPPENFLKIRDPFKSPVSESIAEPLSELEQFPVSDIKLVALMTGAKRVRAVVLLPNGKTHIVGERVRIGTHQGVISRIGADYVAVAEKTVNVLGQEENVELRIRLEEPSKSGGASAAPRALSVPAGWSAQPASPRQAVAPSGPRPGAPPSAAVPALTR